MLTRRSQRLGGAVLVLALLAAIAPIATDGGQGEPAAAKPFVRATLRLTDRETTSLDQGRAVVKTFPDDLKREVTTAGAIRIKGSSARFVEQYRTLEGFRRSSFVLQIAKFSDPPQLADLDTLAMEADDRNALRECQVGDCGLRLSAADIERLRTQVNWQASDADTQAEALFKRILMDHLEAYRSGGIQRLPVYDDETTPVRLADEIKELLQQEPSPMDAAPALRGHLLSFPNGPLPKTEHFFYWSKEAFGFQPVIGLNHVTIHSTDTNRVFIVTTQVYASHYMDGQTAVTALLPEGGTPEHFYWLYFNRARIDRLTGFLGSISRPIVQRRARSGLARTLADTKRRLEAQP